MNVYRDIELQRNLHPVTYWLCKSQFSNPYSKIRLKNAKIDNICVDYEDSLVECVNCHGFDADTFNGLSDEVIKTKALKKKIKLQAMHYQLAAQLPEGLIPNIHVRDSVPPPMYRVLQRGEKQWNQNKKHRSRTLLRKDKHMILKFSKALKEVESHRVVVRRKLLNELGIRSFPKDMCNPDVLPAMSQPIQKACTEFPRTANIIIEKNGLSVYDFEAFLERTQYDLLYRARINHFVKRLNENPAIFDAKIIPQRK